jgi:hypothetical protein
VPDLRAQREPATDGRNGHRSPALTLKVYAQAMRRDENEPAAPAALVDSQKADKGTKASAVPIERAKGRAA